MGNRVLFRRLPRGIYLTELDPVPRNSWDAYRAACEGADFDWDSKSWYARDAEKAVRIQQRLVAAGFDILSSPDVHAAMEREVDVARKSILDARARLERFEAVARRSGRSLYPFQRLDVLWMSSRRYAINCNDMGTGKAQPLDEPVLTPHGYVPLGKLRIGDMVIGSDGAPHAVEAIYRRGYREVFRVEFNDHSFTRCCDEHLWNTRDTNGTFRNGPWKTRPLSEIKKKLRRKNNWFHYIPVMKPAQMQRQDVPLPPYLMGAFLGNAGLTTGTIKFSSADAETLDRIARALPPNVCLRRTRSANPYDYGVVQQTGRQKSGNPVINAFRTLGLFGKGSCSKFIPDIYKYNSIENRLELLRGLMDTDGTVNKDGTVVEYNTCSQRLAEDVTFLIQSLGGVARNTRRISDSGNTDYRVRLSMPPDTNPFHLPRKAIRAVPRTKYLPNRRIAAVVSEGMEEVACIKVSAPDQLYATRNCILTHNTIETLATLADDAATVVCCPAIAKGVWAREAERWRPELRVDVRSGRDSFRWPRPGEMVIINYDILSDAVRPPPADVVDNLVLVGDEAHFLKNKKSKRTKAFSALVARVQRAILLTGTPLPNRPEELWNLLELLGIAREAYGSKKNFVRCFDGFELWQDCGWCRNCEANLELPEGEEPARCTFRKWRGYKWGEPVSESGVRLERVLVRHLKEDVLPELPGKTTRIIPVAIDNEKARRALDAELARVPQLLTMQSMEELEFADISVARSLICRLKLEAIEDIVAAHEDAGEPLVVFSAHRFVVDELAKREGWAAIVGGVKGRNEIEDDFQQGKLRGIAATIQAASTAITLTRSSHAYFIDLSYVPADNDQAAARIDRIGQTRGVILSYLVLDHPIDRHVFALTAKKQGIIEGSVDLARSDKLLTEDDALKLVPKLAPRVPNRPANARPASGVDERNGLWLFHELLGFSPQRPGVDAVFVGLSDRKTMRSAVVDDIVSGLLTPAQWTMVKILSRKYGKLVEAAVGAATRPSEATNGLL